MPEGGRPFFRGPWPTGSGAPRPSGKMVESLWHLEKPWHGNKLLEKSRFPAARKGNFCPSGPGRRLVRVKQVLKFTGRFAEKTKYVVRGNPGQTD